MKKILLIDTIHKVFSETLTDKGFQITDGTTWNFEKIISEIKNFQGIALRSRIKIDKNFIDAAEQLEFIARSGAGMENIDEKYASQKGIICFNSPEGNRDAVAEHAIGMLLSLMNNISKANQETRNHKWIREGNRGTELGGKTVGIIGYGNTGSAFAKRLSGFGVNILAHDKYRTNFATDGILESTLEEIFNETDVLSLHLPLNEETNYYVNEKFISNLKKNIFLINTSRGQIVNTAHLVNGIKSGKILGACLDVNEYEDSSFEASAINKSEKEIPEPLQFLLNSEKVILTPHIAGWTHESNYKLAKILAEKIAEKFSA